MLNKLAKYYLDILNSMSSNLGNQFIDITKKIRYGLTADLGIFSLNFNQLITNDELTFKIQKVRSNFFEEADSLEVDIDEEKPQNENSNREIDLANKELASNIIVNIYRKQEFDQYNREIIVGFPMVSGKVNRKRFCAPIFYYKAKLNYDPVKNVVTLIKDFEIPALNFQLIKYIVEEDEEVEVIRKQILPDLLEDFEPDKLENIIKKLFNLVDIFEEVEITNASDLKTAIDLTKIEGVYLVNALVIFSTTRTNPYLLDDLSELISMESINSNSIANIFISEEIEQSNDASENNNNLNDFIPLFPLLSNRAQRLTALKAENSKLLVIQGPPGTGKSQTIVNLICHLTANGKSVLVVSHQNKALEVITKFMPNIEYFGMSMLKNDKESINELRNKLESFHAYVSGIDVHAYQKYLSNKWEVLRNTYRNIASLEVRFKQLKDIEKNSFSTYKRYNDVKSFYIIHNNDRINDLNDESCIKLKDYYENIIKIKEFYQKYDGNIPLQNKHLDKIIAELKFLSDCFKDITLNILSDEKKVNLSKSISSVNLDLDVVLQQVDELISWNNKNSDKLINAKNFIKLENFKILKAKFENFMKDKTEIERNFLQLEKTFESIKKISSLNKLPQRLNREECKLAINNSKILNSSYKSFFKWYFSKNVRNARKFFQQLGFNKIKRDGKEVNKILAWSYFWNWKYELIERIGIFAKFGIPVKEGAIEDSIDEIAYKVNFIKKSIDVLNSLSEVFNNEIYRQVVLIRSFIDDIACESHKILLNEYLIKARDYLVYKKRLKVLKDSGLLNVFRNEIFIKEIIGNIESLIFDERFKEKEKTLSKLIKEIEIYDKIKKYEMEELSNFENTFRWIREQVFKNEQIPAFENLSNMVEAFKLVNFIKKDLLENPDDTYEISKKIKELKTQCEEKILDIINTQRKIALKNAESDVESLFEINQLIKLLKRKKKTQSFVQLRNKINYRKILNLFPCWIMSIDDVARIFPLEDGLFDYLIVDEASQCNQATVLHLAYRAKRMIVVGDSKQMKNPNTQFLSETIVNLCLTNNELDKHIKSVFLNCRNSLLDLAIGCQDTSPVFLNEHFRCEPPIIEFSNRNFYNNQLKILTPLRNRRFNPCMEIKFVNGAYDTPEDKKVNELEAKAVVEELKRMVEAGELDDERGKKLTVGILSLFRKQALFIQNLVYETFEKNPSILKDHEIIVSTVDGFQGDEKDVILYSFRYAPNSKPGMITVLQRDDEHSLGRLNVAFSRAKRKVVCFISTPIDNFPKGIIRNYLEHVSNVQNSSYNRLGIPGQREKCQSNFERDVYDALVSKGVEVYAQFPCSGFFIDFVVFDKEGRRIAIECDGDFHYDEYGILLEEDLQRQDIIERCGWYVHRIPCRKFYANPEKEIEKVLKTLQSQEIDNEILGALKRASQHNEVTAEEVNTNSQDLTKEEKNILKLIFEEGSMLVWQISERTHLNRDNIIVVLQNLEKKGLLINIENSEGIRSWELSTEGMRIIEKFI
ncbi:MAG: AAA domain-containing protein [Proteobacteria bacterium]|nr:AAA domain-containing protein [Pseudomonadota bacterium]